MKLRRRHTSAAEVVSSPLNDIMFFLLLFFLILSTVASPHVIRVLLPKADSVHEAPRKPVTLTVTQDKKYFVNSEEVSINDLEKKLLSVVDQNDATVVIRPARDLRIQDLVDVLQIGAKNNMRMVLATTKSNSN